MKSTKKERLGWYFYDWANSAFTTSIVTVFLGPYLASVATNAAQLVSPGNNFVEILGIPIKAGSFFPYMLSLSVILQVFLLPWLGAVADYSARKKQLLLLFAYLGAVSTVGLFFLEGTNFLFGGVLFLVANLSFGASIVVYNSFLNDIAEPEMRDTVSSNGWAFGYLGGGLLLALDLIIFTFSNSLGIEKSMAVRLSMASAGLWWAAFTIFPILWLRKNEEYKPVPKGGHIFTIGFRELFSTVKQARRLPKTLYFIVAYLFYNDGVQAVIGLTSVYAVDELKLGNEFLIQVILLVQFVAFLGALLFKFIARATKTKVSLLISIGLWMAAVYYVYQFLMPGDEVRFLAVCLVIALVLGGTQALSRSLFSRFIPRNKEAQYYSIYEISERGTSWLGPFLFGFIYQVTDSYRSAILSLISFFIIGFILLLFVNVGKTEQEAGNEE